MTAHLLAATVAALAAMTAAFALRRGPARWRYALLLAALLRFALPTGWMDAAGRALVPVFPSSVRAPQAVEDLRRLLLHPVPLPADAPAQNGVPPVFLLWTAGAAVCMWLWARRWGVRLPAVRPANAAEIAAFGRARQALRVRRAVELRIVAAERVPGALGYFRPAVVLPDGLAAQLSDSEVDAVMAHELAHLLRRDNLWAAAAHGIVAVFWFHPLVWWIERCMLKEREIACDELVLDRGTPPEVYLSGILKVCRMAFGGAAGYAGANGSNLGKRMERIMSANIARSSYWSRALAGGLVAIASLFPLAGGYLKAQQQPTGNPAKARTLFDQGKALLERKDYDGAERAFRRAYELDPQNSRNVLGVVEAELAAGRPEEALALIGEEAAQHPGRVDLQMAAGNVAVRLGKYDQAIARYQKVLASMDNNDPQRGDVYQRLGETYRRMNDFPQATAALRQAVELQPDAPLPRSTLALVLDAAGHADEAEQAYRKVLVLTPNNAVALNNLAFLLVERGGDLDEALAYAQQARKALPDMTEVLDTLGYVYLARKSGEEAYNAFREAVLKAPAEVGYRTHLLLAIELKGDRSATSEALKTALREKPTEANQALVTKLLQ